MPPKGKGRGADSLPNIIPSVPSSRLPQDVADRINRECARRNCKVPPGQLKKIADERREAVKEDLVRSLTQTTHKGQLRRAEAEAERRLRKTFQTKSAVLETMGIDSDLVFPLDDGVFQGDLLLADSQMDVIIERGRKAKDKRKNNQGRGKRSIYYFDNPTVQTYRWDVSQPISYYINSDLKTEEIALVTEAIAAVQANVGCIRFQRVNSPPGGPHIQFDHFAVNINGLCGTSKLGMTEVNRIPINFESPLCVGDNPRNIWGRIVHEVMHSFGVAHQQNRADRDDHISVNWNVLPKILADNYQKSNNQSFSSYGVPYNLLSIMHYPAITETITAFFPTDSSVGLNRIGQRSAVSSDDWELMRRAYCCPDSCQDVASLCGYVVNFLNHANIQEHNELLREVCPRSAGVCC